MTDCMLLRAGVRGEGAERPPLPAQVVLNSMEFIAKEQ